MNKTKRYICVIIVFFGAAVAMLLGFIVSSLRSAQSAGDGSSKISGEKQGRTNADDMVYGSYQNKTWVVDGENFYDGNGYSITLYITQITDEIVEGHIALNGMVGYNSDGTWEDFYPEFCGTMHDGKAHCEYEDKKGEVRNIDLTFHDDNWIQAMMDGDENQSYQLRPYNISDLYYINEPTWFEAELDGWGTVTVFYANSLSNHTTPNIMLTDGRGDILYDFKGGTYGYQSGTEVLDIIIRDMNQDGLTDIEIITCGFDGIGEEKWCAEWYFYQREDRMFIYDETDFVTANNTKYS